MRRRCGLVQRRAGKSPLGSAAGYGTPGLPIDRDATRAEAAVRGGARAGHGRAALARQGRSAAAVRDRRCSCRISGASPRTCCCSTRRSSRSLELPDAFTTGSSIMPQKRNPDVFELIRGRSATALGCLIEALAVSARSCPSGYQRDLQLLKIPVVPRHRPGAADARYPASGDRCHEDSAPSASSWIRQSTRPKKPTGSSSTEGIPFREAYRRVAAKLKR